MIALAWMRVAGFVRSGRCLAPLVAVLVVLSILYGGGPSRAAAAYGYSAAALFAVLAWITKLVLDTEPDVQRRLARLAVGPAREAAAGLLAAGLLGAGVCALAMLAPWAFGGISGPAIGVGILLGVLAHLLALAGALALGALAGRAVTRRVMPGVAVLVSGGVLAVVLGLSDSIAPWLVPPVMATARALSEDAAPAAGDLLWLVIRTLLWCAAALGIYARLRRARA
ncbi:hypothetical protein FB565_005098 [Actinoplanes lutulentus]|uniref:ABC-2 type transport system permease protein n=1 Tax=Actinoplanes lutulentus TaxID=1287878 RepID=A0A327ZI41_9ACTN|nr:hypothetical protein [Actinoplanes lutulentus]MBB2945365.1 hypothetical protein [Actinoplanes lutulentus]RAK40503.1 hypothetical protein B0I29_103537 [Actinoplanes lutulentus]